MKKIKFPDSDTSLLLLEYTDGPSGVVTIDNYARLYNNLLKYAYSIGEINSANSGLNVLRNWVRNEFSAEVGDKCDILDYDRGDRKIWITFEKPETKSYINLIIQ